MTEDEWQTFSAAQVATIQRVISQAWRKHFARQQRAKGLMLVRVSVASGQDTNVPVIVGSFTASRWKHSIPMRYSLSSKSFTCEVWMNAIDTFQVLNKTNSVVLPHFLQAKNREKWTGTCMLPARNERHYQYLLRFHARKTGNGPLLSFCAAASLYPKYGKVSEDAHLLSDFVLGVADGVGGWQSLGIDSGIFAAELMQACREQSALLWTYHTQGGDSSVLLPVAAAALGSVRTLGSATLLLCGIKNRKLEVLNLGDSQARLYRLADASARLVLRTQPLQHRFNCPFQVTKPLSPHEMQYLNSTYRKSSQTGHFISDSLFDADIYTAEVEPGDLLIVASDGLWDNLFDEEVAAEVKAGVAAEYIARRLTKRAQERARTKETTPFEKEAMAAFGRRVWKGGKEDDITVLAAWIRELPS